MNVERSCIKLKKYPIDGIDSDSRASLSEAIIEKCCQHEKLVITVKGTLRSYPRSIHWHFKKSTGEKGTLEITLWKERHAAWLSVQDGRKAKWIDDIVGPLKKYIEQSIKRV